MSTNYLEIVNFNQKFKKTTSPIIINDLPYITEEDRSAFNMILLSTYDTDVLSSTPRCRCGSVMEGNASFYENTYCPTCKTKIQLPSERDIEFRSWFRVPEGVRGFILPIIWVQFTKMLNFRGYNLMEWIVNPNSRPPNQIAKITAARIERLNQLGWVRGLNYFIDNFDEFLKIFITFLPSTSKRKGLKFIEFIQNNRDCIFPEYLPLPTETMLILMKVRSTTYADTESITGAIDAARTMADISMPRNRPLTQKQLESKVVSIIVNLVSFYETTIRKNWMKKRGLLRGQLFSSRSHFYERGVITSLSDPHYYEELHIPWSQAIVLFKEHLTSKLLRMKYTLDEAEQILELSGVIYSPVIDLLFREIICEGTEMVRAGTEKFLEYPMFGIPAAFQRNPSLDRLSGACYYVTLVKTRISDKTISMSPMVTKGPNADFDGDEMNLSIFMGEDHVKAGQKIRYHYGVYDLCRLGDIRNVANLPDVTVSTVSNYLAREDEVETLCCA